MTAVALILTQPLTFPVILRLAFPVILRLTFPVILRLTFPVILRLTFPVILRLDRRIGSRAPVRKCVTTEGRAGFDRSSGQAGG